MPETQLDDDILYNGVGVQQHVDEGGWEVEKAVFEVGEEGDFGLGCGGGFAGGGGHFVGDSVCVCCERVIWLLGL